MILYIIIILIIYLFIYLFLIYICNIKKYTINNVFDQVYLINLKKDKKKFKIMDKKLKKYNIKYKLFPGINGSKIKNIKLLRYGTAGAVGIKKTQMNIIKDAIKKKYNRILIMEDDLIFIKDFLKKFNQGYKKIIKKHNDWKLLYLGCSFKYDFKKPRKGFVNANNSLGNFSVGVDKSVFKKILKSEKDNRPIDDIFVEDIQKKKYKSIVFDPMVITADVRKPSTTDGKETLEWYYIRNDIDVKDYIF